MKNIKYLIFAFCLFILARGLKAELRNPVSNTGSESKHLVVEYGYEEGRSGYTMLNPNKADEDWKKWEQVYRKKGTESFALGGKYLNIFKQEGEPLSAGLWYQYEKMEPLEVLGGSVSADDVSSMTFTNGVGYIVEKHFPENFRLTFQGEHKLYSFETVRNSGIDKENLVKLDFFKGFQGEAKRLSLEYDLKDYLPGSANKNCQHTTIFTFWRKDVSDRWSLGMNYRREQYAYLARVLATTTDTRYSKDSYIMNLLWPSVELSFPEKGIFKAVYTSFEPYKYKERLSVDPKLSFYGFSSSLWIGTGFYVVDFPELSFSASVDYAQHQFRNVDRLDKNISGSIDFSIKLFEHFSVGFDVSRENGDSSVDTEDEIYESYGFSTKVWF
ncbi:MAG: hypothetical protein A3J83_08360 [Elusimicrobia bacterium RIFOXYA2_FULL_40_6]|nr:MAG: hypothetical protein A3J83_08360 [Elusimicrobia bacterium RIFOXYA2_FULL_40_6]